MRYPIVVNRPVHLPDGSILRPERRDDLARVLQPRATMQTGGTRTMATQRQDPFADHKVADPAFLSWDKEGTEVVGIIRGIREQPGRNQQIARFMDLAIGRDDAGNPKMVACSIPTTLWAKIQAAGVKRGSGVKIVYTGSHRTGSGNNTKDFDFYALPSTMDLASLPADTWGVKQGTVSDKPAALEEEDDDLPF